MTRRNRTEPPLETRIVDGLACEIVMQAVAADIHYGCFRRYIPTLFTFEAWASAHAFASCEAMIFKLLWDGRGREPLRDALGIIGGSQFFGSKTHPVRNNGEHFDRKLVEWLRRNPDRVHSGVAWCGGTAPPKKARAIERENARVLHEDAQTFSCFEELIDIPHEASQIELLRVACGVHLSRSRPRIRRARELTGSTQAVRLGRIIHETAARGLFLRGRLQNVQDAARESAFAHVGGLLAKLYPAVPWENADFARKTRRQRRLIRTARKKA